MGMLIPAYAATETVSVNFLPMQEAAAVVKSQLSSRGRVAALASRRMLIMEDDAVHIKQAAALLQRLDQPATQYTAFVDFAETTMESRNAQAVSATAGAPLRGGWVRLGIDQHKTQGSHRQSFQLRITAGQPGDIEAGSIQPSRRNTRQWLSGYGVITSTSVERISITSGFRILAQPAGGDQIRVQIIPWVKRLEKHIQGQHEILIDLGTAQSPASPPLPGAAPMRLNASPGAETQNIVELAGAATEVTIPVGETAIIAASSDEAEKLGRALLSRHSTIGQRQFTIRLRLTSRPWSRE
jgi:hypothetical protein